MPSIIRPSINFRQQCRWHGYATNSELEHAAVQTILNASQQAINRRGSFKIVLAGGTTPHRVYQLLCTVETDWSKWHVYFGDERCLPADHPERNSVMATQAWLSQAGIPANQTHIIPAEQGPELAANIYAKILSGIDMFDLVLLGLGEDGHTASLFPHHDWGTSSDAPATLSVHDAPKPPSERVSLSASRLSKTHQLIFLVTGSAKRQAVNDWRKGKDIPASAIKPGCGVDIFLENELL